MNYEGRIKGIGWKKRGRRECRNIEGEQKDTNITSKGKEKRDKRGNAGMERRYEKILEEMRKLKGIKREISKFKKKVRGELR